MSIKILFMLALWGLFFSQDTHQIDYKYKYKSDKSILSYYYKTKSDSAFMYGQLKQKRNDQPLYDINIEIKDQRIGTVPDLEGKFILFLPKENGIIKFYKVGYDKFEFEYHYKKETEFAK